MEEVDSNINKKQQLFLQMYDACKIQMSSYCKALTGDYALASDILQESLVITWEGFDKIKKPESFKFFLMTIAKRIYLKSQRHQKISIESISVNHFVSEEKSSTAIDNELLYKAISKLPIEQKEALVMFEIMGYSLKEIEEIQKVTLSAVKSRVTRAREKLAELLSDVEQKVPTKNIKTLKPQSHE